MSAQPAGHSIRQVAIATLSTGGFSSFVASTLHRRSDCYRVERISSRAGLSPAVDQRVFTAHMRPIQVEFGKFLRGFIFPKDWRYGCRDPRSL